MVVLLVAAILTGAIVPSLVSAARRGGVEAAATRVLDMFDFANAAAISRREAVTVNFDPERHLCWVSVQRTRLPWIEDDDEPVARTLAAAQLPEGIEITLERGTFAAPRASSEQTWQTVRFEADGTAEDVLVELTDERGDCRTLEVIAVTGEAGLKEDI